jgi:aspartyl-tRNA(Asn)/glutamyl-tRNA(Gln) amidotransferase subunit C
MKITAKEVAHVAELARLKISEAEMKEYTGQLNAILEYSCRLDRLDTAGIEPTAHVLPLRNVFRADIKKECLPRDQVLANSPGSEEGMFRVPAVLEAGEVEP